ncbi:hypothetical protein COO60DRAFT_1509815 [Scenedesmus sp. NREL 46B-D3]|nr:hypothetical protein COO60DRAFT_1509815 [Scenedesmus sp. NREL 46B-D3]
MLAQGRGLLLCLCTFQSWHWQPLRAVVVSMAGICQLSDHVHRRLGLLCCAVLQTSACVHMLCGVGSVVLAPTNSLCLGTSTIVKRQPDPGSAGTHCSCILCMTLLIPQWLHSHRV